ncbi:MAG TPA: cyclic nucleotide-binding domain-containing protein [Polyangiaceae bacterium]|jgi:CRP-like cAMP-binding protein|nr:cyclic nucleotide-binding domain-containing protein [Polyangiaceae bacterium]
MSQPRIPVNGPLADAPPSIDRLRDIGLLGALSDEVLEHLAKNLQQRRIAAGATIFQEGDAAHDMFVVLDGEVEVLKKSRRGRVQRVAILGPSDAFGEMSIIDVQPRSATVRALAPTRLLRIAAEDLDALYRHDVKSYAIVVLNVARDLSRRLRVTDGLLADIAANVLDEYVR